MKLYIVAVGTRTPTWVAQGYLEFAKRMPREMPLQLLEVKAEPRTSGKTVAAMRSAEAVRLRAAAPAASRLVLLDERGADLDTPALAARLQAWQDGGSDVALLVGGPDGIAPELRAQAHETLRLSSLTLPHALVRVVLAEALYRAASLSRNHPYHRE